MQIKKFTLTLLSLVVAAAAVPAHAVITFTETFNTGANGWLNGPSAVPTYIATGGVGDSGYISYNAGSFTTGNGTAYPGFDPVVTQLMFRANAANDASGDAFVGNWVADGVTTLTLSVRHNYTTSLDFYARFAAASPPAPLGAGASLAPGFTVAPNTWTTVVIDITDSNPPFLSYGSGNFNNVFSNILNMQFGFYLPSQTGFTDFTMDIDNVSVQAVPEPSTYALMALGLGVLCFVHYRRREAALLRR